MARGTGTEIQATVKDSASAKIKEIANAVAAEADKIAKSDDKLAVSAKGARMAKQMQLTASQKLKLAMEKEAAAGDAAKLKLVALKETYMKAERKARAYANAGKEIPPGLIKEANEARKASEAIEKLGNETEKTGNKTKSAGESFRGGAKSFAKIGGAAAAAGAAIVAAGFAMAKSTAAFGDNAIKTAQRLGVTVEEYQRLDHAMQISGTSMDAQKGAMNRLFKGMQDASEGIGEGKKAFDSLGISVTDSTGKLKNTGVMIREVSEKFSGLDQGPRRAALAMQIFGKSGNDLTQFLNLGSKGIAELGDEADRLGVVMSTGAAQASERFIDSLTRMQAGSKGLRDVIGVSLMPAFQVFTDAIGNTGKTSKETMELIRVSIATVIKVIGTLISWGLSLGLRLGNVFRGIVLVANTMLLGIATVVDEAAKLLGNMLSPFEALFDGLKRMGIIGFNPITEGMEMITGATGALRETFEATTQEMAQDMADAELATQNQVAAFDSLIEKSATAAITIQTKTNPAIRNSTILINAETDAIKKSTKATGAKVKAAVLATAELDKLHASQMKQSEERKTKLEEEAAGVIGAFTGPVSAGFQALGANIENAAEGFKQFAKIALTAVLDFVSQSIMAYAASAAAAAYASQAAIPIIGPILGAVAMAAALGLVRGLLTKMQAGGIVPGTGTGDRVPALLEPGELVLPRALSKKILEVVGQPSSGGGFQAGGMVAAGGGGGGFGGVTVNITENMLAPRTPGQLDKFVKDQLMPSLNRLKRRGFAT